MIMYAFVTGQSVAACFLSTLVPGVLLTAMFSAVNVYLVKTRMPSVEILTRRFRAEKMTLIGGKTKTRDRRHHPAGHHPRGDIRRRHDRPPRPRPSRSCTPLFLSLFVYRSVSAGKALLFLRLLRHRDGNDDAHDLLRRHPGVGSTRWSRFPRWFPDCC